MTTTLRPKWILFGDSITQRSFGPGGWGALIADNWQRKIDVINRGYSGFNTKQAIHLLPYVFPESDKGIVQLATLFFGANDAALPDRTSSQQHVPLEEYKRNLHAMVSHLKSLHIHHIILITPPPVSEPHRFIHVEKTYGVKLEKPERTNTTAGQYADAVITVGEDLGLPVLDLWRSFQEERNWQERLLCDGLHLTAEGNTLVGVLLKELIGSSFKDELAFDSLPWDLPEWRDLVDSPEVALSEFMKSKEKKEEGRRRN